MSSEDQIAEPVQGWSAIPNWIVRDQEISGRAKLVYMCLNSRASERGETFPSHALISKEAGVSVSSVKLALNELKAKGIVHWEKRIDPRDGSQSSNRYFLKSTRITPGKPEATP